MNAHLERFGKSRKGSSMAQLNAQEAIAKFIANAPVEWTPHKGKLSAANTAEIPEGDDWDITYNGQNIGRVERLGKRIYTAFTRYPREVGL